MKKTFISILALLLMLAIAFMAGRRSKQASGGGVEIKRDTTTIVTHDTAFIEKPVPVRDRRLEDSLVAVVSLSQLQGAMIDSLLAVLTEALAQDSVQVVLPTEQVEYGDSSYHAWVSGYRPRLDSIEVYGKTVIHTVTIHEVERRSDWGIGLQGGMGVTVVEGKVVAAPCISIGVTYTPLHFPKMRGR